VHILATRVPEPPSIEALFVSFNTRDTLRDALSSLLRHAPPADTAALRISVLDNGSSDGSAAMVAEEFPEARLHRSAVNLGFARANNELARTSTADYLLLLNSDVILTEDVVMPLLGALLEDPRVIAAGPRLVYPDGQVQYSAHRLPTLAYEFALVLRGRPLARAIRPLFDSQRVIDEVH
jgi:N-acetylglucosaminyl-diphospho-decaprenol L-rhamnosyltransferase